MPIHIRLMTPQDIPAGMQLKEAAGWNQVKEDLECFLELRPQGCFVAESDGQVVGTVTTVPYFNVAWVSFLLVDEQFRRRGIGGRLLERAIENLAPCPTVKLDATEEGKALYSRYSFLEECSLSRMVCEDFTPADIPSSVRPLSAADLESVLQEDAEIFGADRGELLRRWHTAYPDYAWISESGSGYCFGRAGSRWNHLGPLVAPDLATAKVLLQAATARLGQAIVVDAFGHSPPWLAWLESLGFREARRLTRMVRGQENPYDRPGFQWAAGGPEWG